MADPQKVVLQNVAVDGSITTIAPATLAECVVTQDINNTGRNTVAALLKDLYSFHSTVSKNLSTLSTEVNSFKSTTNETLQTLANNYTTLSNSHNELNLVVSSNYSSLNNSIKNLTSTVSGLSNTQVALQTTVNTLNKKLEKVAAFKYGDSSPTHVGSEGEVYFEY